MGKLKLFIIIFFITGGGCSFMEQRNANSVLIKLGKHQYGWSYIVITSNQKPMKIGEYYVFNSDGVCIIDRKSLNDSTRMKVMDNLGNDATSRCKEFMKSFEDKNRTIVYKFYCVDSNQTNWSDSEIGVIEVNRDSAFKHIKKMEYLENKGYFN